MDHLGFTNTISSWNREFMVKTIYDETTNEVVTNVSENGHELNRYNFELDKNLQNLDIKNRTEEKHKTIVNDWKLLFTIYEKVKKSDHALSLNKLGLVLTQRKLLSEAIECFMSAINVDPKLTDAYINLGKAYLKAEIYQDAIDVLNKAIQVSPKSADIYCLLGIAQLKNQNIRQTMDHLEKALEINPNYDSCHFMIGLAYLISIVRNEEIPEKTDENLRQDKILFHLQKAQDLNAFFDLESLRQAKIKIEEKNYSEALELLQGVENLMNTKETNHFDDEFYLKFMFGGKSKDDNVILDYIQLLQQKIKKKQNYPDLHNNLGVAYLIQCRNMFLKAMEQFRLALKLNPGFENAKKNLKLAENEGKGFIILLRALLK